MAASPRRAPSWYDGPDERALREEAARRAQVRDEARELEEDERAERPSAIARFRRSWAKRKADRVFGAEDGASPAGEGGPRAALYKGEMGASQRRASRMQDDGAAEGKRTGKASGKRFHMGPKLRIFAASAACLALVCVFLYQPAQQCYQSLRERDALAAEYAALEQRSAALQSAVDTLSTDAGMEDLAHDQYGLVKEGEIAVEVTGLDADTEIESGSSVPPNVPQGGVEPPDTWYSGVLDPLFGVE